MRVTQAAIQSPTGSGQLHLGALSPGMNAYRSDSPADSGAMADAVSHLLLGRDDRRWSALPYTRGEVHIALGDDAPGDVLVRLRRSGDRHRPQLTLARVEAASGSPPAEPSAWLGGVPASVMSVVFFGAQREVDPLRPLLSAEVAEAFSRLTARRAPGRPRDRRDNNPSTAYRADEPRNDEALLRRRDELAARIESLFGERRRESETLDQRLGELQRERDTLAAEAEELSGRLGGVAGTLATIGARVRYEELSRVAEEAEGRQAADDWAPRVEELDSEVARWRSTLAELESRESYVRGELARIHPDDAAPELSLADQRASVAVAQRLIADLESEVARFAHAGDSPHCVCRDAHPRLNPLVEMLGRHLGRLSELVTEQDRALRTQDLLAEADQLERSQTELRRQLERLLQQRQTLWRTSRSRTAKVEGSPYGDAATDHDRQTLEADHATLTAELSRREAALEQIDRELAELSQRRSRLLDEGGLASLQRELEAVQADLRRGGDRDITVTHGAALRASDVLANLSDGELTQLRLAPGGRSVAARDRTGRVLAQQELTASQHRLVAWALRLALADACCLAGVEFPLLLDEPFADLDPRHAANLATALDDYQRRGRQLIVMTGSHTAIERLRSLGVSVRSLRGEAPNAKPTVVRETPVVREEVVRRGLLLDVADDIDRFPVPVENRRQAFLAARVRTVGDLIGADPSALAEELAIDGVTAELVALWQSHVALVCFVPGLELADAKRLAECGLLSVEDLSEADAAELATEWRRRYGADAPTGAIEGWIELAADGVARWRSSGYAESWRRNRQERRERIDRNASRRGSGERDGSLRLRRSSRGSERSERAERHTGRRRGKSEKRSSEPSLRFYLETTSDVEAAPSIGPKMAARLAKRGVETVAQLLAVDPEDLAERLDDKRVDTAAIVAWQHQAGLMCRVPGLRGHDAQILVGCGFTTPEEIAAMKPAELLEFVEPFCSTTEGQRYLRGGSEPDLAEVSDWIDWARKRRVLGAA